MVIRIMSWDVGIVHLAYCVLEYKPIEAENKDEDEGKNDSKSDGKGDSKSEPQHSIDIVDWDVINLIEGEQPRLTCCGKVKGTKTKAARTCGKNASFQLSTPTDNEPKGFCRTHLAQHASYWSPIQTLDLFEKIDNSDCTCAFAKADASLCGKKATHISNIKEPVHYCTTHGKSEIAKRTREFSPQPIKLKSSSDYPTRELQINLIKHLNSLSEHFAKLSITDIVIENQPSLINPRMKSIASTLLDYFLIKGCVDKVHGFDLELVKYMSPNNKLKVGENKTLEVVKVVRAKTKIKTTNKKKDSTSKEDEVEIEAKKTYKLTKALSIQYTKQLIDEEQLEYLELYGKQDDICDAYLQGRYYLEHVKFKPVVVKPKPGSRTKAAGRIKAKPKSKPIIKVVPKSKSGSKVRATVKPTRSKNNVIRL